MFLTKNEIKEIGKECAIELERRLIEHAKSAPNGTLIIESKDLTQNTLPCSLRGSLSDG